MSLFPLIQRPCPYIDRLESVMEGDFCRMCKREVRDLTEMDEAGRKAFLAACGGDACVRYTLNVKPALAAALIAASAAVLVAPDPALARKHTVSRPHHPRPPVPVTHVPVMLAGALPMPERPPEPVRTPRAPDTPPPPVPK